MVPNAFVRDLALVEHRDSSHFGGLCDDREHGDRRDVFRQVSQV